MGRGIHCVVLLALALALVLAPASRAQGSTTKPTDTGANNVSTSFPYPPGYVYIDCGGAETPVAGSKPTSYHSTNVTGTPATYSITPNSTTTGNVSVKYTLLGDAERSLRAFPSGGCYAVDLAFNGTWSLRLGFAYYNYDGQNTFPNFTVSFNGLVVDQVSLADWENPALVDPYGTSPNGGIVGVSHYTEYVQSVNDTQAVVCFEPEVGSSVVVNSLELVPYPSKLFDQVANSLEGLQWSLSLKQRLRLGGPDLELGDDPFLRRWHGERHRTTLFFEPTPRVLVPTYTNVTDDSTANSTLVEDGALWPTQLFEAALQGGPVNKSDPRSFMFLGIRMNYWPLLPSNHLLVRLFFKEVNGSVTPGQRTFNITFAAYVEDDTALWEGAWDPFVLSFNFDIAERVAVANEQASGFFTDFEGCHPDPAPFRTNMSLFLFLSSDASPLPPILSGLELYEIVTEEDGIGQCPPISFQPFFNQSVAGASSYPPISADNNGAVPLSTGAIVGVALAAAVAAVLVVAAVAFIVRRWKNRNAEEFQRFHSEGF